MLGPVDRHRAEQQYQAALRLRPDHAYAHYNLAMLLAVDSAGNVYVADRFNEEIRKITPAGVVTTLAGSAGQTGSSDGTGSAARFANPNGVAVDSAGNVYVADLSNDEIRKITPVRRGHHLGRLRLGKQVPAMAPAARQDLIIPQGVAVDSAGNVYVADDVQ